MKTGRTERIAEEIRKVAVDVIQFEMADPRFQDIQVTTVKVTADLSLARVYFNFHDKSLATKKAIADAIKALRGAAGHLRHEVAQTLTSKHVPKFDFYYDESEELQNKVDELFEQIESKEP